ncbi:MAG: hypothetical protein ACJ748_13030 [Flavisolibacter sp.]
MWYIDIEQGINCSFFHGMGAPFSGSYKHKSELVIDRGYLNEIDLIEIERLTGKYLPNFLDNFQQVFSSQDVNDKSLTVIDAGVKGM